MNENKLPAGVMDEHIEFFVHDQKLYCISGGIKAEFREWEISILNKLRGAIEDDPKVCRAFDLLHITDPIEQIRMFARCRFGGAFDERPDISTSGIMIPEFASCCDKECAGRNIICKFPEAKNGPLTEREIDIVKLIVLDLPDKIIADRLGISPFTLAIHRRNIESKVGCSTKVGIAVFAINHNIC